MEEMKKKIFLILLAEETGNGQITRFNSFNLDAFPNHRNETGNIPIRQIMKSLLDIQGTHVNPQDKLDSVLVELVKVLK